MSSNSEHLRQSGRDCEHELVLEDMIATSRVFLGRLLLRTPQAGSWRPRHSAPRTRRLAAAEIGTHAKNASLPPESSGSCKSHKGVGRRAGPARCWAGLDDRWRRPQRPTAVMGAADMNPT